MDELFILNDLQCKCIDLPNNIGDNAQEMVVLFKEELPYYFLDTISGQCIIWDEDFIAKCLEAMATGSLANFSDIEKQVWYAFVEFQDSMTNSAPSTYPNAIGCTIPDELGNSYIVTTIGITSDMCLSPATSVAKERQSASLDNYFMDLYNCETTNECGLKIGEVTDISPCPL